MTQVFEVSGMHCGGCASRVERAAAGLAPGATVTLDPPRLTLPLMPGTRVSLYPMGPARGTSQGLEWPIDGILFAPGGRVGTSNRATGLVSLRMEGPMLVMLPRSCLGTVLTALAR